MLKIHKPFSKHKLFLISVTSICITFGLLGFYYLTYTPELSHAESVTYEKTIDDITYMQEMTPEICKSMELEKQYQLTDIRKNFDGTQPKYWIARLKDGNCWMTQNLDLDIPAEGLKAEDTDIPIDWTAETNPTYPPLKTQTRNLSGFDGTISSQLYDEINSYDPAQGGADKYCVNSECNNLSTTSSNNGHDAQDNYYSWGAATAGQAATLTSTERGEQATQSICPKGWRLPLSGRSTENVLWNDNKSFAHLFESYGWTWNKGYYTDNLTGGTQYSILNSPFYFVYGGYVSDSSLLDAGSYGYYWSSTARNAFYAYILNFSTSVYPSYYNYRYFGLSVRCVARSESTPNSNVEVVVNPTISLDVADEVVVERSEANPSTASLGVKVSSNQKYSVGISAGNPNLTSTTSEVKIPARSGLLNAAENGWGIKLKDDTEFTALTSDLQTFYTASGAEIKTIPFTIGISTAPDIPNGEYSTDIIITATQN